VNYQLRALQISFALHAFVFLLFIFMGDRFVSAKKFVVIDLTLEDPIILRGYQNKSTVNNHEQKLKINIPANMEQKTETPELKKEVLPPVVQTVKQISSVETQAKFSADNASNKEQEDILVWNVTAKAQSNADTISLSSADRSIKPTSAGVSENVRDSGTGYLKANFSYIKDMINKKLTYPKTARQMGWEGKAKVSFTILLNGDARDIRIIQSSGREILDKNAVEAVKNASPFPGPPIAAEIIIPILYKLN
jgi:periplasmic protein TonB